MPGLSAEQRNQLIERILGAVDPRLIASVRAEFTLPAAAEPPHAARTVVIGGHRAAGKSRLLPLVSALLGRPGLDLDIELEQRTGRSLREWVATDTEGFRAAERALFLSLPPGSCVAVGGGFLSHHPDALEGSYTLLVPISFETYRERLLQDTRRPRLRPGVSLEEELSAIYEQRTLLHRRVPTVGLGEFLRAMSPRSPE
ncbi:shikimate kinase [Melittangium boletus DSM 14713]|uniref:Shikimate kinase n=1 Tax=Melittangium boletus DSM 14713 TaxID=1294270 RepID=A0A250IQ31_9BACT|nr:shikimate kinase [Melittangium boletus DSM 14713]